MTEREHTGKKIVDCQIIGPAAAGSAGYVASPMYKLISYTIITITTTSGFTAFSAGNPAEWASDQLPTVTTNLSASYKLIFSISHNP